MNRIVCFGEALWDVRPDGRVPGGAPMNVALRLSRLGRAVEFVSRVGCDAAGDDLIAWLQTEGLATCGIQRDASVPTGHVRVDLTNPSEARYDIVAPAAWDFIETPPVLPTGSTLVFGSLAARSAVSRESLLQTLAHASRRVFDVNLRPPFVQRAVIEALLQSADWVKLNEDELRLIARWHGADSGIEATMRLLADRYELDVVCVTLGRRGATMLLDGSIYSQSGFDVAVVDTIGCGDSFLACWLHELLTGSDPQAALRRACAMGALVATQAGGNPAISPAEIDALTAR